MKNEKPSTLFIVTIIIFIAVVLFVTYQLGYSDGYTEEQYDSIENICNLNDSTRSKTHLNMRVEGKDTVIYYISSVKVGKPKRESY